MSLRTGTELITLSVLFNKLTGVYGLVAILTGFHLSATQLSMYLYSIAALVLVLYLMPHIRLQSPLQCLGLAWFYIIDTIVNAAYTATFAITWFLTVSQSHSDTPGAPDAPGSGTIDETAGFTSPKYNVSHVDVVATPDAVAVGAAGAAVASAASPSLGHGVSLAESMPSIILVVAFTLMRIYFIIIVMSYARQVLRTYTYSADAPRLRVQTGAENAIGAQAEDPFKADAPLGSGWKGKLGRMMVTVGNGYWLGGPVDDAWAKGMDGRFRKSGIVAPLGTGERERRARSGTGPPMPSPHLTKV